MENEYVKLRFQKVQAELEQCRLELAHSQAELQANQIELERSQAQLHHAQTELARSQEKIAAMENSKFWQFRTGWFKLRRGFGLRDDSLSLLHFPKSKARKLKQVWKRGGLWGLIDFLFRRIIIRNRNIATYQDWIKENQLNPKDILICQEQMSQWQIHPKFSVIMPVYNIEQLWLEKAIESVRCQIYPHWELCIADDASTETHIDSILRHYSELDSRIKVVFGETNRGISVASNSALELVTGDYIVLLDHDDELSIEALFENAKLINRHPEADFIYSDEDKINTNGQRSDPFFKPDWSPDYFHACMYTCHLGVYRTSLVREIGGFRSQYDGAQDWDLVLRLVEKTTHIFHIPKILYHWRIIPSSTTAGDQAKPWAYIAARKALEAMLERNNHAGSVEELPRKGFFRVRRNIIGNPLVSIVIPSAGKMKNITRGEICLLENCIYSIQQLSTYRNFEIIVVDGYDIPDPIVRSIAAPNVRLVRCSEPFNFSHRINQGAAQTQGEMLLLLNDDTEVLTVEWLESMIEFSQMPEIGAVGAKLLFPDDKIQHAGVLVLNGNPGHPFYGYSKDDPGYFCSNLVTRNYSAVTGACLMTRKQVFQDLGGLDERFPLNYNDVDLCLKALQAGYRIVVTPYAELIHYESVSRISRIEPRELALLHTKWSEFPAFQQDPYYNPQLSTLNANFELKL